MSAGVVSAVYLIGEFVELLYLYCIQLSVRLHNSLIVTSYKSVSSRLGVTL